MNFDVLVIGGGVAGLYTALKLAPKKVLLVADTNIGEGGATAWAQGGIAAAVDFDDNPSQHALDTLNAGDGLCDFDAVETLTQGAPQAIEDLEKLGLEFARTAQGTYDLHQEGAHSTRRVLHIDGDQTGYALTKHLAALCNNADHIQVISNIRLYDLLKNSDGSFSAHFYKLKTAQQVFVTCSQVVLATGGAAGLWKSTTNPSSSTGIALSLAYKLGAQLRDLEFMQFHPTAIDIGKDPMPLATEALRGDGAKLVNKNRLSLMQLYSNGTDLAPRFEVARAVYLAKNAGDGAFLDLSQVQNMATKFPYVTSLCKVAGINPAKDLLPISMAAHYHMGGVLTNLEGRSTVPGLFVVGEAASTGVHGANRLASNSLLEGLVFGERAALALLNDTSANISSTLIEGNQTLDISPISHEPLRHMVDLSLSPIRTNQNMQALLEDLPLEDLLSSNPVHAYQGVVAHLIVKCALSRKETRGAHRTLDFKDKLPSATHTLCQRQSSGLCEITHAPAQPFSNQKPQIGYAH